MAATLPAPYISHQNITHCNSLWPFGDIFFDQGYLIFNSISSLLGVLGNLLLLAGLFKSKLIKQNTMKIIFCLALSDFGISLLVIPGMMTIRFGIKLNCQLELALTVFSVLLGINTANMLLLLSLDRVLLISSPVLYRKWISSKLIKILLCCSWFVSLVLALCRLVSSPVLISRMLVAVGMAYVIVSTISYVRIFFVVRSHKRKLRDSQCTATQTSTAVKAPSVNDGSMPKLKKRISFKMQVEVFEETPPGYHGVSPETEPGALPGSATVPTGPVEVAFLPIPKDRKACDYDRNPGSNSDTSKIVAKGPRGVEGFCKGNSNVESGQTTGTEGAKRILPVSGKNKRQYFSRFMPLNFHDKDERAGSTKSRQSGSFQKELSVTGTVAIVIVSLFICYIPYIWSAFLWADMEYTQNVHASFRRRSLYAWASTFAFLHSSLSPIIMVVRNRTLRRSIKQAVKQLCMLD